MGAERGLHPLLQALCSVDRGTESLFAILETWGWAPVRVTVALKATLDAEPVKGVMAGVCPG